MIAIPVGAVFLSALLAGMHVGEGNLYPALFFIGLAVVNVIIAISIK